MKPICVSCQRFFRVKKNNFPFIEAMPVDGAVAGNAYPDHWTPYKLWAGDLWECEGCKAQIVVGVARVPLTEHYKPDFAEVVKDHAPTLQVNDC